MVQRRYKQSQSLQKSKREIIGSREARIARVGPEQNLLSFNFLVHFAGHLVVTLLAHRAIR